jgi:hypothetical protein
MKFPRFYRSGRTVTERSGMLLTAEDAEYAEGRGMAYLFLLLCGPLRPLR